LTYFNIWLCGPTGPPGTCQATRRLSSKGGTCWCCFFRAD